MPALVLSPTRPHADAPGVLWIHGGGYATGMKEMVFMSRAVDLVERYGAVVVSPAYRLSWQAPYPAALHDSTRPCCGCASMRPSWVSTPHSSWWVARALVAD